VATVPPYADGHECYFNAKTPRREAAINTSVILKYFVCALRVAKTERGCGSCGKLQCWETELMKRVFTSPDSAEVGLLKNMLLKAGIRCVEINEQMAQVIPSPPFQAELWVENEADYAAAAALLEQWKQPLPSTGTSWTCSRCGEELGSQFSKCWKCGTRRDAAA
jgi:hypothetical protein